MANIWLAKKQWGVNILLIIAKSKEKISLSLQDKEASKYLYTNGVKTCQFREKESQIKSYWFCAGNISKDFAVDNMKIAKLNGKGLRACC